jgi:predicted DNA-binding transcriptional regulator YafY
LVSIHADALDYFGRYLNGRHEVITHSGDSDWLKLRVIYESSEEARRCVLGLGTHIDVIEPDDLRQMVIETARAILAFYAAQAS